MLMKSLRCSVFKSYLMTILYPVIMAIFLSACSELDTPMGKQTSSDTQAKLPISLNEVMVALVNQAADPIWVAAWQNPETAKDWRNLEYLGYQLEVAGALLTVPGTGPFDQQWTEDPQWEAFSNQLKESGIQARQAAVRKDLEMLAKAGDQIVEVCEGCHKAFKLALPTGGIFGELSPVPTN